MCVCVCVPDGAYFACFSAASGLASLSQGQATFIANMIRSERETEKESEREFCDFISVDFSVCEML